ncbi:MAG TPA: protein YgfX [Rudaea sp.]|nr:protein YgfX [Rudaea sp.]
MKSAIAIAFDYRPSRWLVAAVTLMALLAFAAIALSGMPSWAGIFAVIFAAACAGFALGRYLHPLVRRAAWQQAGHWRVADADGREFTAELIRGVVRGAWIVLNLRRSDGKDLALILGPDNCTADTRRQLRVRLSRIERGA